ncbi:hypothetical protein BS78_09G245700 [Paspalum vaginatum]|nr:hypothetical protein BS78_09G245700 [Paspalum vaginatum]
MDSDPKSTVETNVRQSVLYVGSSAHTSRMHARRPDTCWRGHIPLRAFNSLPAISQLLSHRQTETDGAIHPCPATAARASSTTQARTHARDRRASMADRHVRDIGERPGYPSPDSPSAATLLRRVQTHAPNSAQVVGFLALLVSGAVLLLLTGLTLTGAVVALVFLGPLALLTSPIWVPVAVALFLVAALALSTCGFVVAGLALGTWVYRYLTGRHPVGADRVDYARSRIAHTATHVKDYARDYVHSRSKDAAPGA